MPALVNGAVLEFELGNGSGRHPADALELGGDDPDVLFNRGFALQAAGDLGGAARDFERARPPAPTGAAARPSPPGRRRCPLTTPSSARSSATCPRRSPSSRPSTTPASRTG
jgi:hypothetical protein